MGPVGWLECWMQSTGDIHPKGKVSSRNWNWIPLLADNFHYFIKFICFTLFFFYRVAE